MSENSLRQHVPRQNMLRTALADPEFYRRDLMPSARNALAGLIAGAAGAPVDLATMALRPFGYSVPPEQVAGSSEWLGERLGANVDSLPFVAGSVGPVPDATDAVRIASKVDPGSLLATLGAVGSGIRRGADDAAGKVADSTRRASKSVEDLEKEGFDTSTPLYHGTTVRFDKFRPGSYFSVDRRYADDWISGVPEEYDPHVRTVYLRGRQYEAGDHETNLIFSDPSLLDEGEALERASLLRELEREGYSSIYSPINGGEVYVFNPNDIIDVPDL